MKTKIVITEKVKLLSNRVLVKVEKPASLSDCIYLPPSATEKDNLIGVVVDVGPGDIDSAGNIIQMATKPGDRIIFGRFAGIEVLIDNENHRIFREPDVLGVLESV